MVNLMSGGKLKDSFEKSVNETLFTKIQKSIDASNSKVVEGGKGIKSCKWQKCI